MVGLRIYVCASSALSAYLVLGGGSIFPETDAAGRLAAFALLFAVAFLGVFDTIINDVLGHDWRLGFTLNWRQDGYIALAVANLAMIFVAASRGSEGAHLTRFALDAVMAIYVAMKDVQFRFIEPRKEKHIHPPC